MKQFHSDGFLGQRGEAYAYTYDDGGRQYVALLSQEELQLADELGGGPWHDHFISQLKFAYLKKITLEQLNGISTTKQKKAPQDSQQGGLHH